MRHDFKVHAASCLQRLGITRWAENRRKVIHILMLHKVNPVDHPLGLSIGPGLFEEVVVFLKEKYGILSLDQALGRLAGPDPGKGCVLTFDDGYRDNYDYAFPILKKHGAPATIFVTLDALDSGVFAWEPFDRAILAASRSELDLESFGLGSLPLLEDRGPLLGELHQKLKALPHARKCEIVNHVVAQLGDGMPGERSMLSWSEAREMADSGLMTIGAHTISHPILSRVEPETARREIVEGKALIEERLGRAVRHFAYPNGGRGDFDASHVSLVAGGGYLSACTTLAGNCTSGSDPFRLKRIDLTPSVCLDTRGAFCPALLTAKLSGLFMRGGD